MMNDRKVFLVLLFLGAMSSVHLSMGKISTSFKSSKDEVRDADKKEVDNSKASATKTNEPVYTNFKISPSAQAASSYVAQKGGYNVNTAPSKQGCTTKDCAATSQKGGDMANTAPLKKGGAEDSASKAHEANTASENKGRGADYAVEKREQGRKLASIIANFAFASADAPSSMSTDSKKMAEEMVSDAINMASDLTSDAKNKAFDMASDAKSKAANMTSDAMNNGLGIAPDLKVSGNLKMHAASEYAKHIANRAMNTASEMGRNTMNKVTDKAGADAYGLNPKKVDEPMEKASKAYQHASGKVDEIIRMATEKRRDAKMRFGNVAAHGKDKALESYIEAKALAQEAYKVAKNTMTEKAKEKYEMAKEKASAATGDLGAYISNGVWEL